MAFFNIGIQPKRVHKKKKAFDSLVGWGTGAFSPDQTTGLRSIVIKWAAEKTSKYPQAVNSPSQTPPISGSRQLSHPFPSK